ncbi:CNNM domain-containing protein [uncultured Cedecea sp.]|uniref:CNNM domain-containing protein n=1 Tax=uncultured Cedecea sp. TaxID=988762 RepID=UPI00260418B9|nr:hemolysin family protein [uncultured Cedecea sp.]
MNDPLFVTLATLALIILSGLFVIIEFALLGSRRHRLEEMAINSRSARAALRGMNDLTLMLAGAQLGITFCTFALGAITKPAVDFWLEPLLVAWGIPLWVAGGTSFVLAFFVVTFLHLVIGEMAPKSWAIANPERSALAVGIIAQVYIWPLRSLMRGLNRLANRLVRAAGVEPVESAAVGGQDIATIRQLVEHSAKTGTLEPQVQQQITSLIDLVTVQVKTLLVGKKGPTFLPADVTVADIRDAAQRSGHQRILLSGKAESMPLVVHLRDTLMEQDDRPACEIARPAFIIDSTTPIYESLALMRKSSVQFAVVMEDLNMCGVVTLNDILKRILPAASSA